MNTNFRKRNLTAFVVLAVTAFACVTQSAPPQYRHRDVSIPPAGPDEAVRETFSSSAAKRHLDLGADLWSKQKQCISCHTHGIYLFVRPALSERWGKPPKSVRDFLTVQTKELREDGDTYGSAPAQLAYMSRGLAAWDAAFEDATSQETDSALRHLFENMQAEDGSIQVKFRYPPINSDTWHATVTAALAVSMAPGWRAANQTGVMAKPVENLADYLRKTPPLNDHHRLQLLWAASHWPGLLDEDRRKRIEDRIWSLQRPDGGWSVRSFAAPEELGGGGAKAQALKREPEYGDPPSDGYQTALSIVVLRDAGVPAEDARLQRAVAWLKGHQRESGRWWTKSLNTASRFHYISYSGSAYAALALAKCGALGKAE